MLDAPFSKNFMIKCSRASSPAVMLYVIYDHHVWQDLHRSALDLWKEKAENLTTILHSQELIWSLAPWCFQFYSDPNNPPKPHLKHHSQFQLIAEGDQSALPRQPRAPSITAVALECCDMGLSQTQTWPASTDTRIWTSLERLFSENIVKSVTNTHDATSLRN